MTNKNSSGEIIWDLPKRHIQIYAESNNNDQIKLNNL